MDEILDEHENADALLDDSIFEEVDLDLLEDEEKPISDDLNEEEEEEEEEEILDELDALIAEEEEEDGLDFDGDDED